MIKTDHRRTARLCRNPEDPRDAAVFRAQLPLDELVPKYQEPL
jgi:hypothetical protein